MAESGNSQPGLAVIANCMTPYRLNLHELIVAGIPELKLHTLITHDAADFSWSLDRVDALHVARFGRPGDSPMAGTFRAPYHEWSKGGRLIDYLKRNNIRAVITNGYRYISYLRVIQHCHSNGIPLFVRNDSNIRNERHLSHSRQFWKSRLYSCWMPRVAGWMSMGELGDQFFLKYGASPQRLYRVPYTPNYQTFQSCNPDELRKFRQRYRLSEQKKYLIFSGRLVRAKRLDLLLDAFVKLAPDRPQWDLLIIGDGNEKQLLVQRIPEGLTSRVIWTGFLEQDQLNLAYHSADVLVVPSEREAWAVVVQEAMAAGLTVVASDVVGAADELIEDGQSGRIFSSGDVHSLYRALEDATRNTKAFQEQAKASLQHWRARIDPVAEIRRALCDVGVLDVTNFAGGNQPPLTSCIHA